MFPAYTPTEKKTNVGGGDGFRLYTLLAINEIACAFPLRVDPSKRYEAKSRIGMQSILYPRNPREADSAHRDYAAARASAGPGIA